MSYPTSEKPFLAWFLLVGVACGGGDDAPPRQHFAPLDSDGAHFRDADGRTVILRGLNARVEGVFDVTFDDGRVALEEIPELTLADCARMAELGFNLLRLPVSWSALEPERDQFDEAYLVAVDAAIECAAGVGIFVVVDFHQDAYSKEIGEDGAPLWAIEPAPTMLLEGPLDDLEARRTSDQVLAAFESFFAAGDPHGLQAELQGAIVHVATRYAAHPGVIGFELFNEPQTTAPLLEAFHFAAAARVREVAPEKLVFFEPPVIRNFIDFQPLASAPFPVAGSVYSPHVYTFAFTDPQGRLETITIDELRASNVNARDEATAWGAPLFVGEFGIGPYQPNYEKYLGFQYDLQDEVLASSAFWLWKEQSQGSWGLHEFGAGVFSERPAMIAATSRPYAQRIAGTAARMRWDAAAGTLTVAYSAAVAAPNLVFVPERFVLAGATCDGAPVTPSGGPRALEIVCGGGDGEHELVVTLATP